MDFKWVVKSIIYLKI